MRVIKLLVGHPPRTVGDLIHETGVTRTAVTEQLNDLVSSGFVERTIERLPGRGRPRHRFAATNAALLLLFANNQRLVVPAIWKAVEKIGGEAMMQKVLRSVSRQLMEYYQEKITATDPKTRLEQFAAILEQEGGLVDLIAEEGQLVIRKRTCAFISMFDDKRHVCEIDVEMMSAIAGCPVRQTSCRHDGDSCCQFEVDTRSRNGAHTAHIAK
jgi:predicted ArsR family transcriptional regulator